MITMNGGAFSGGQRQRLLIARALASRPRILLLDEATSALDNVTQRIVTRNLAEVGMTRIVVAHRLSTIIDADRIVVLDHGAVAEHGTYDQLMAQGGAFHALATRQVV
jgi:ATP-binding cassette subfamily C protein